MKILNELVIVLGVVAILSVALYYYKGLNTETGAVFTGGVNLLKQAQNIQTSYPSG